jgi:myo-inositol-1-phosphate synthase
MNNLNIKRNIRFRMKKIFKEKIIKSLLLLIQEIIIKINYLEPRKNVQNKLICLTK